MNRFYIAFPIFSPTAISQIMVGLTITHHIPFTEIFLLIKGHLLTWIAEKWRRGLLLLPPIRAAEYGSFKKLESRYHAIIFHALRCLRNDIESFLVLITKNSPDHLCRGVVRGVAGVATAWPRLLQYFRYRFIRPSALKPLSPKALKFSNPQTLKLSTPQNIKPSNP